MKFFIDMPVSPSLAVWLSKQGHNAIHISQLGMSQAADQTVLDYASKENSIVITADLDFPRLLAIMGAHSPGIILFRGGNYTESGMKMLMERVLHAIPAEEMEKSIVVVDKIRIRKVKLPIG